MRHQVSHLPRPLHNGQHNTVKSLLRHNAYHSLGTEMVHRLPVMVETGRVRIRKDTLLLRLHPYLRHPSSKFSCQLQTAGAYSVYWRRSRMPIQIKRYYQLGQLLVRWGWTCNSEVRPLPFTFPSVLSAKIPSQETILDVHHALGRRKYC